MEYAAAINIQDTSCPREAVARPPAAPANRESQASPLPASVLAQQTAPKKRAAATPIGMQCEAFSVGSDPEPALFGLLGLVG